MTLFEEINFDLKSEDIISLFDLSQDSIICEDFTYFSDQEDKDSNLNNQLKSDYKDKKDFQEISDKELLETPIKHLNNILKSKSELDCKDIKKKRRKLKNRIYARESRNRKQVQKMLFQNESNQLMSEIKRLQSIVDQLKNERDYYKDRCKSLQISATEN